MKTNTKKVQNDEKNTTQYGLKMKREMDREREKANSEYLLYIIRKMVRTLNIMLPSLRLNMRNERACSQTFLTLEIKIEHTHTHAYEYEYEYITLSIHATYTEYWILVQMMIRAVVQLVQLTRGPTHYCA